MIVTAVATDGERKAQISRLAHVLRFKCQIASRVVEIREMKSDAIRPAGTKRVDVPPPNGFRLGEKAPPPQSGFRNPSALHSWKL
jgi:hypothetical protein